MEASVAHFFFQNRDVTFLFRAGGSERACAPEAGSGFGLPAPFIAEATLAADGFDDGRVSKPGESTPDRYRDYRRRRDRQPHPRFQVTRMQFRFKRLHAHQLQYRHFAQQPESLWIVPRLNRNQRARLVRALLGPICGKCIQRILRACR